MTASTNFIDQVTTVTADWLNAVDEHVFAEFSVKDYGAVGDGVSDDRFEIDACIDAAIASGLPAKVVFPPGIYKVGQNIGSYTPTQPLILDFQGSTIDASSAGTFTALLWFFGAEGTPVPLSLNATIGEQVVVVGNTSTFSRGQYVKIYSTALWDSFNTNVKLGELNRIPKAVDTVTSVNVNYLPLAVPLSDTYTTANAANVIPVTMVPQVKVLNGNFIGPSTNQNSCVAIRFQFCEAPQVIGCSFTKFDTASVFFKHTDKALCTASKFFNSRPSGLGYGVEVADTAIDTLVVGNHFEDVRHAVSINNTTSIDFGVVRRVTFIGNTVKCSAPSLGTPSTFTADTVSNRLTFATPNLQFTTGRRVKVSTTGTLPSPLDITQEYWTREFALVGGQTSEVKLYVKLEDAAADLNAIDILSTGTGTHSCVAYGGGDAVDTHGGGDFIKIIGNHISGSSSHGINIECPNVEITGNTIVSPFAYGINVRNECDRNGRAIIANNTVYSPNGAGIVLTQGIRGTGFAYTAGAITGNVIYNAGRLSTLWGYNAGIVVNGGTTTMRSITVSGNTVNTTAAEGIYLNNIRGAAVTGNQIYNCTTYGIYGFNVLYSSIGTNSIQTASASTFNGIRLDATGAGQTSYCSITGNTIGPQTGVAVGASIQFTNNVTNCNVVGNVSGYPTAVTLGAGAGNAQTSNI